MFLRLPKTSSCSSGWWCNNHLETYESQWERIIPYIIIMVNKKSLKPPTSHIYVHHFSSSRNQSSFQRSLPVPLPSSTPRTPRTPKTAPNSVPGDAPRAGCCSPWGPRRPARSPARRQRRPNAPWRGRRNTARKRRRTGGSAESGNCGDGRDFRGGLVWMECFEVVSWVGSFMCELKLGEFMMAWMRNMHVMLDIEALELYLSRRRTASGSHLIGQKNSQVILIRLNRSHMFGGTEIENNNH